MHMPGHKGKAQLGFEKYDITEIVGADSLYHANGIIKQSEENATSLFGTSATLYSTEGSSHVIRAMLYLCKLYSNDKNGYVLASRNAHSSFISACVLNDLDIEWIYPDSNGSYLSCVVTEEKLRNTLTRMDKSPICVYITSPDYLGNMCDISALSRVCREHGTVLIVDNAHGAYLKFLENDLHPISNGALMCCDSAHKTLPVLTGGAYLHISKNAPEFFRENSKQALSMFGSTSPSYLTLASLDNANKYLSDGYCERLNRFVSDLNNRKKRCKLFQGQATSKLCEPMKITIEAKKFGYRGDDFAAILENSGIACEFFDEDYVVLMPSVETEEEELDTLFSALEAMELKNPIEEVENKLIPPKKAMTVREAAFAQRELVSAACALGRILAISTVSCPPAVSVIVCGEQFNESALALCKKYGFSSFYVVK